jgi:hypothetical protein
MIDIFSFGTTGSDGPEHRQAERQAANGALAFVDRSVPLVRPPMFGRRTELDHLRAAVESVVGGHAQVVLVEGEAGIGKTQLAAEGVVQAPHSGVQLSGGAVQGEVSATSPRRPDAALSGSSSRFRHRRVVSPSP